MTTTTKSTPAAKSKSAGKLIRYRDLLDKDERARYNTRAENLVQKHRADIDRLDTLLADSGLWLGVPSGFYDRSDREATAAILETGNYDPQIDLRKPDLAGQLSDLLGELAADLLSAKKRIDKARRAGEFPRPRIVAFQVVVDGKVRYRTDSPSLAARVMDECGGDVLAEFADGSTEPAENSFVEFVRCEMAKRAEG